MQWCRVFTLSLKPCIRRNRVHLFRKASHIPCRPTSHHFLSSQVASSSSQAAWNVSSFQHLADTAGFLRMPASRLKNETNQLPPSPTGGGITKIMMKKYAFPLTMCSGTMYMFLGSLSFNPFNPRVWRLACQRNYTKHKLLPRP